MLKLSYGGTAGRSLTGTLLATHMRQDWKSGIKKRVFLIKIHFFQLNFIKWKEEAILQDLLIYVCSLCFTFTLNSNNCDPALTAVSAVV